MKRALLCIAALAACNDDPLQGMPIDLAAPAPVDMAMPAKACTTHVYETVALDLLGFYENPVVLGQAVEIAVDVPLRDGCDVMGPVDIAVMPGNATDAIVVTGHRWRQVGGMCPDPTPHSPRRIALAASAPLSSPHLVLRDGAPGGTLTVDAMTVVAPGDCTPSADPICSRSCQCMTGKLCFGASCALPCSEDVDCPPGTPVCRDGQCANGPGACVCGFGQLCNDSGACGPAQDDSHLGVACSCDGDCGFGMVCAGGKCLAPCITAHDCRGPMPICEAAQGCVPWNE